MVHVYQLNFPGDSGTSIPSGTSFTSSDGVVKMTIINSGNQTIEYSDQNQYVYFNGTDYHSESNTSYIEIEILDRDYMFYTVEQEFGSPGSSGSFFNIYYKDGVK